MNKKTKSFLAAVFITLFAGMLMLYSASLLFAARKNTPSAEGGDSAQLAPIAYEADDLAFIGEGVTLAKNATYAITDAVGFKVFASYILSDSYDSSIKFVLKKDIKMNLNPLWTSGAFESSYFKASFDGQGHTITFTQPYVVKEKVSGWGGLFYRLAGNDAVVKNVGIHADFTIADPLENAMVGGIVGYCDGISVARTIIDSCYFSGSITGGENTNRTSFGGIAGKLPGDDTTVSIENSFSTGKITLRTSNYLNSVAGITASIEGNGTIENCYSTMELISNSFIYGIASTNNTSGHPANESPTFNNCYFAGKLRAFAGGYSGQFFGIAYRLAAINVSNCYYLEDCGYTTYEDMTLEEAAYGTVKPRADMYKQETYAGFTFNDTGIAKTGEWVLKAADDIADYYPELSVFADNESITSRYDSKVSAANAKQTYEIAYNEDSIAGAEMTDAMGNVTAYEKVVSYTGVANVAIPDPLIPGKTFLGWSVNGSDILQKGYVIPSGTTGKIILTAQWSYIDYTIWLNLDGGTYLGTQDTASIAYTREKDKVTLSYPTKKGYDFLGWYEDGSEAGTAVKDYVLETSRAEDVRLTASWTPTVYTVSYDASDPAVKYAENTPTEFRILQNAVIPAAEKNGYTLTGWKIRNQTLGTDKTVTVLNAQPIELNATDYYGNILLTPIWQINTYDVVYDFAGGTIGDQTMKTTYTVLDMFYVNQIPTRTGYVFLGWVQVTEKEGVENEIGDPVKSFAVSEGTAGNLKFRAKWEAISISIIFADVYQYQGRNYEDVVKEKMGGSLTYAYGATFGATGNIITLPVPELSYRTFKGWRIAGILHSTTGEYTFSTTEYLTDTVTFEAVFDYTIYGIKYELDGGKNAEGNPITYDYDTPTFYLQTPTRINYDFKGWITGTEEGGNIVYDENTLTFSPEIARYSFGDKYFKAVWEATVYTITWHDVPAEVIQANNLPTSYKVTDGQISIVASNIMHDGYKYSQFICLQMSETAMSTIVFPWMKNGQGSDLDISVIRAAIEYSIALDANGGTYTASFVPKYTVETTVILPIPTKDYYTFMGWLKTKSDGTSEGGEPVKEVVITGTGNVYYKAVWQDKTGAIIFLLVGEGESEEGIINSNGASYSATSDTLLSKPIRNGYTFRGWTCAQISGASTPKLEFVIPQGTTADLTIVAHWEIAVYTISYITGGGEFTQDADYPQQYSIVGAEKGFTLSDRIEKKGYDFAGWYIKGASDASAKLEWTISDPTPNGYTFCAKWVEHEYQIFFDLGENGTLQNQPTAFTISQMITVGAPQRPGYTFTGWTGTKITGTVTMLVINSRKDTYEDASYVANWKEVVYNINYVLEGGSFPQSVTIAKDFTVTSEFKLPLPTKLGYKFQNWYYIDRENQSHVIEKLQPQLFYESMIFYANWGDAIEYTVQYYLDGAQDFNGLKNYTVEQGFSLTEIPVKRGYLFKGWSYDKGNNVTAVYYAPGTIAENFVFTANWELQTYSIYYNLGDNGSQSGNPTTSYDVTQNEITLTTPKRTGYTFLRWTTNIEGIVIQNGGSDKYTVGVDGIVKLQDLSFIAIWEATEFTITYSNVDEGILNSDDYIFVKRYTVESNEILVPEISREGYEFKGWIMNGGSIASLSVKLAKGSYHQNLTFNAVWEAKTYSITYWLNGGSFRPTEYYRQNYTIATEDFILPTPVRNGYDFAGWRKNNGSNIEENVTVQKGTTGALLYSAEYRLHTYTIEYFEAQSDEAVDNPVSYTVETPTFTLKNPSRIGYTFMGWVGSDISSPETVVIVTQGEKYKNLVYTARWEVTSYVIVYNLNGGSVTGIPNPSSYTVADTVTLSRPEKEGYTFIGWQVENEDGLQMDYVITNRTGNIMMAATWQKNAEYLEFKESTNGSALVKIETKNGFTPDMQLSIEKIDPTTLKQQTVSAIGDISDIKYIYTLKLSGDVQHDTDTVSYRGTGNRILKAAAYSQTLTVRLYGAENGYKVIQLTEDGGILDLDYYTDGNYFVFTTDTLSTYAVVKTHEPMSAAVKWGIIGSGIAAVLIAGIILLIRFTVFRKYELSFEGVEIESYKIRKGSYLLLPTGYYWFEDEGLSKPFSYARMPARNLTAYTYATQTAKMLPYENYVPLPAGGGNVPGLESGTNGYLGTGDVKLLGDGNHDPYTAAAPDFGQTSGAQFGANGTNFNTPFEANSAAGFDNVFAPYGGSDFGAAFDQNGGTGAGSGFDAGAFDPNQPFGGNNGNQN